MWRRINSIGIIMDCNSTYAANLGYAKSEIIGRSIFEHVPKDEWEAMNDSLKTWFDTGESTDRKITFQRHDGSTFPGLLQATSLYDHGGNLLGSNTIIFDLTQMDDERIGRYAEFFRRANARLKEIRRHGYGELDRYSRSEHDGLEKMFGVLLGMDLAELRLMRNLDN
jgi:PAS domain S-box-containing protein